MIRLDLALALSCWPSAFWPLRHDRQIREAYNIQQKRFHDITLKINYWFRSKSVREFYFCHENVQHRKSSMLVIFPKKKKKNEKWVKSTKNIRNMNKFLKHFNHLQWTFWTSNDSPVIVEFLKRRSTYWWQKTGCRKRWKMTSLFKKDRVQTESK